jgi:hypothetical protein
MRRGLSFAPGALLVITFVAAFAVASRPDAASPSDVVITRGAEPAGVRPLHAVAALPPAIGVAAPVRPQRVETTARSHRHRARSRAVRSRRHAVPALAAQPPPQPTPVATTEPPDATPVPQTTVVPAVTPRPVATAPPPVATPTPRSAKPEGRFDSSGGFESEG